jgi:2-keto-3-deoxy-galactonokinase
MPCRAASVGTPTPEGHVSYILALDRGTTSSRAILFDRDGGIKGVAPREPQPLEGVLLIA